MKEIIVDAITSNVELVTDFVNSYLEKNNCPDNIITKLDIAIDELFSNIANYSYGDATGSVTVRVRYDKIENQVVVTFIDEGIEYNPLAKPDPDSSVVEDEGIIGGLGIFIAKNLMDNIEYKYDDGKNILVIYKKTNK